MSGTLTGTNVIHLKQCCCFITTTQYKPDSLVLLKSYMGNHSKKWHTEQWSSEFSQLFHTLFKLWHKREVMILNSGSHTYITSLLQSNIWKYTYTQSILSIQNTCSEYTAMAMTNCFHFRANLPPSTKHSGKLLWGIVNNFSWQHSWSYDLPECIYQSGCLGSCTNGPIMKDCPWCFKMLISRWIWIWDDNRDMLVRIK